MQLSRGAIVNLFHIFVVSLLLIYVGYKKNRTPEWAYTALLVLGVLALIYHSYRLSQRM